MTPDPSRTTSDVWARPSWWSDLAALFVLLIVAGASQLLLGPIATVVVAIITLLVAIVLCRPSPVDISASSVMVLLLLATAYPLFLSHITDVSLVALTSGRRIFFHQPDWVATALAVVMFQCAALMIASAGSDRRFGGIATLLAPRSRSPWQGTALLALGMIASTVLANRTSTILAGHYGEVTALQTEWFSGWPVLFCAFGGWYTVRTRMSRWYDFAFWYLLIAYWLFHGNRSEVLIQAVLPILVFVTRGPVLWRVLGSNFNWRRLPAAVLMAVAVVILFEGVGLLRSHALVQLPDVSAEIEVPPLLADVPPGQSSGAAPRASTSDLPATIDIAPPRPPTAIEQVRDVAARVGYLARTTDESRGVALSTVGPSAYTLVAVIGLVEIGELHWEYGCTFLQYIYRMLPSRLGLFPAQMEDLAHSLIRDAGALGGSHFAAEAYWNFGIFGAIGLAFLVGKYFGFLARNSFDEMTAAFLVSSVFYLPRFSWYGYIYLYKLALFFAAIYFCRIAWAILRVGAQKILRGLK